MMAKDFDQFQEFLMKDCLHEINAIGSSFGDVFTDEDFKATGMTEEQLGAIMNIVGYAVSQSVMVILRRYHEWLTEFPD